MRAVDERFCDGTAFNGLESYLREWEESAQRAMAAEPKYFENWAKVKGALLLGVSGLLIWQFWR